MSEYNEMTPRELMLRIEAYNESMAIQYRQMLTQAYLTAAWQRSKRMPRLNEVLKDATPKKTAKQQTPEEMFAIVKHLDKRFSKER